MPRKRKGNNKSKPKVPVKPVERVRPKVPYWEDPVYRFVSGMQRRAQTVGHEAEVARYSELMQRLVEKKLPDDAYFTLDAQRRELQRQQKAERKKNQKKPANVQEPASNVDVTALKRRVFNPQTSQQNMIKSLEAMPAAERKKTISSLTTFLRSKIKKYLQEIDRVSSMFPDMLIIPGCETSAYYYWTGSYFKDDLTAHDYDKRILVLNFNEPDDYNNIPNLHNKMSLRYTKKLLPAAVIFFGCLLLGVYLMLCKGTFRILGFIFVIVSILAIANHNPFRSSIFTQYDGDRGIAPYQELIDYVNERGGFTFWNYPEQKSGIRKHGPIFVNTPIYPEVIHESRNYTGFAAIYGEYTKATKPGGEWDIVLNEYCRGKREKPPWAISTGDFHEDGRLGLKLGAFPTTFLVKEFSKKAVLEAIERGRMYCSRGNSKTWPKLVDFNISGDDGTKYYMGETLTSTHVPIVRFNISYETEKPLTVLLIRGGEVIKTIEGKPPIELEYRDQDIPQGKKTYYRVMDTKEHLVSNPIFVTYNPEPQI